MRELAYIGLISCFLTLGTATVYADNSCNGMLVSYTSLISDQDSVETSDPSLAQVSQGAYSGYCIPGGTKSGSSYGFRSSGGETCVVTLGSDLPASNKPIICSLFLITPSPTESVLVGTVENDAGQECCINVDD